MISTTAELAGFALLALAAWMLNPIAGVAVAGLALLFVGYATDDGQVAVSARKIAQPFQRARAARKQKRAIRRQRKDAA